MGSTTELKVGVVGTGAMGADHVERLVTTTTGASVSAIIEPDSARAQAAAALAPDAQVFGAIEDAIAADAMDAVIVATPGRFHEPVLLPALAAGLPILCEKPLADDLESCERILEVEQRAGRQLVQVGFMRRFDREYQQLRELIASGSAGELLMLRAVHRNPAVPEAYTESMLITDSVVHELDVLPWLAGASVHSVEVRYARRNSLNAEHLREPILVIIELDSGVLVDVEMNVSIRFGYQVATEAVFEQGIARIGQPSGLQVQMWVDAAKRGEIAGPSAFDAYKVALACEAGLEALVTELPVPVAMPETPAVYAMDTSTAA